MKNLFQRVTASILMLMLCSAIFAFGYVSNSPPGSFKIVPETENSIAPVTAEVSADFTGAREPVRIGGNYRLKSNNITAAEDTDDDNRIFLPEADKKSLMFAYLQPTIVRLE